MEEDEGRIEEREEEEDDRNILKLVHTINLWVEKTVSMMNWVHPVWIFHHALKKNFCCHCV